MGRFSGGGGKASPAVRAWADKKFALTEHADAFVKWFGDSKVVNDAGEPLVVHKGMPKKNWQTGEDIKEIQSPNGPWAGFFSDSQSVADRFAKAYSFTTGGSHVVSGYAKIEKPYIIDAKGGAAKTVQFDRLVDVKGVGLRVKVEPKIEAIIKSGKYDGIIVKNTSDEGTIYVPFKSAQVKSTSNSGAFSKDESHIEKSLSLKFNPNHATDGRFSSAGGSRRGRSGVKQSPEEVRKNRIDTAMSQFDKGMEAAGLSDTEKQYRRESYEAVVSKLSTSAIGSLGSPHGDRIDIVHHKTPEALTEAVFDQYPIMRKEAPLGAVMGGLYDGMNQSLHLTGDAQHEGRKVPAKHSYAHEIGHVLDGGHAMEHGDPICTSRDWMAAWKSEIKAPGSPLSKYAETSPDEGFAEFSRLALTDTKAARTQFPKSWAAWSVGNFLHESPDETKSASGGAMPEIYDLAFRSRKKKIFCDGSRPVAPASEKFFDGVTTKFNPNHDHLGRFASGSGRRVKPNIASTASPAADTTPQAAFVAAVAQSVIDNEGWEERLIAHEAMQKRILTKVEAALEAHDSGVELTAEQKKSYRSAFVGVMDGMNNHALSKLEEHLDDVKFYHSAKSLTEQVVGLNRLPEGSVVLGAWSGARDSANGSLHLDGGASGKHDVYAAQQVYAHEVAHAIDWVPGKVTKIPIHKLKVSADEAEKTILDRIDKLPLSDRRKEVERANVLWNLGEPDSFDALGIKTDDLYKVAGHRELHTPGREISRTAKWISAHNAEIDTLDAAGKQIFPLSKYATTSASEGFAEFGRLVFTAPKQAKTMYPKCWAVWLEHGLVGSPQQQKTSAE